MQDLHERMAAVVDSTAERMRDTPGQRPQEQCVWRFSVRRRPGKIKDNKKKEQGQAPRVHLACFLIVFDKVGKPTERNRPEGPQSS